MKGQFNPLTGEKVPFLQYIESFISEFDQRPMRGESRMRGYYLGRYRDRNFLGTQIEYRILPFSFSERLGASVFMATGQVFGDDRFLSWQHFLPTGGAGLRFLIFPDKDIYTRLDFAFTQAGNGVYFFIGEAF